MEAKIQPRPIPACISLEDPVSLENIDRDSMAILPCGHIFSEKSAKEVLECRKKCPKCQNPCSMENFILVRDLSNDSSQEHLDLLVFGLMFEEVNIQAFVHELGVSEQKCNNTLQRVKLIRFYRNLFTITGHFYLPTELDELLEAHFNDFPEEVNEARLNFVIKAINDTKENNQLDKLNDYTTKIASYYNVRNERGNQARLNQLVKKLGMLIQSIAMEDRDVEKALKFSTYELALAKVIRLGGDVKDFLKVVGKILLALSIACYGCYLMSPLPIIWKIPLTILIIGSFYVFQK